MVRRAIMISDKMTTRAICWGGIFALASVFLFAGLGSNFTLRRHEAYVGVGAREMLETGDWLVPRFGGQPRLEKPPLAYWLVAALGGLYGEINEWTLRLPAAISALLLIGLIGVWGTRWYGSEVGQCAAFIQATSLYTIQWGRIGIIDVSLTLLTTLALFLAAEPFCAGHSSEKNDLSNPRSYNTTGRWIIIYTLLGLSSLAKPAFGMVLAVYTCVIFLLFERRYRDLWYLFSPIGLLIVLGLALAWPIAVARDRPEIWPTLYDETIGRAVGEGSTHNAEPLWFYSIAVLQITLPWTPAILAAIPGSWRRAWREGDLRERFLWVWFLSQFLLLHLSSGKNEPYLLPALPPLTLICSRKLAPYGYFLSKSEQLQRSLPLLMRGLAFFVCTVLAVWLMLANISPAHAGFIAAMAVLGGSGSLLFIAALRRRSQSIFAVAMGVILGCYLISTFRVVPMNDFRRPSARFAEQAGRQLPDHQPIITYGLPRPPLVFYLYRRTMDLSRLDEVQERVQRDGVIYLIAQEGALAELEKIGESKILQRMNSTAERKPPDDSTNLILVEMSRKNAAAQKISSISIVGRLH